MTQLAKEKVQQSSSEILSETSDAKKAKAADELLVLKGMIEKAEKELMSLVSIKDEKRSIDAEALKIFLRTTHEDLSRCLENSSGVNSEGTENSKLVNDGYVLCVRAYFWAAEVLQDDYFLSLARALARERNLETSNPIDNYMFSKMILGALKKTPGEESQFWWQENELDLPKLPEALVKKHLLEYERVVSWGNDLQGQYTYMALSAFKTTFYGYGLNREPGLSDKLASLSIKITTAKESVKDEKAKAALQEALNILQEKRLYYDLPYLFDELTVKIALATEVLSTESEGIKESKGTDFFGIEKRVAEKTDLLVQELSDILEEVRRIKEAELKPKNESTKQAERMLKFHQAVQENMKEIDREVEEIKKIEIESFFDNGCFGVGIGSQLRVLHEKFIESKKDVPDTIFNASSVSLLLINSEEFLKEIKNVRAAVAPLQKFKDAIFAYIKKKEALPFGQMTDQRKKFLGRLKILDKKVQKQLYCFEKLSGDALLSLNQSVTEGIKDREMHCRHIYRVNQLMEIYEYMQSKREAIAQEWSSLKSFVSDSVYKSIVALFSELDRALSKMSPETFEGCNLVLRKIRDIKLAILFEIERAENSILQRGIVKLLNALEKKAERLREMWMSDFAPPKPKPEKCKKMAEEFVDQYQDSKKTPYKFIQERIVHPSAAGNILAGLLVIANEALDKIEKNKGDFSGDLKRYLETLHEMLHQCFRVNQRFKTRDARLMEGARKALARGYEVASKVFKDGRFLQYSQVDEKKSGKTSGIEVAFHRDSEMRMAEISEVIHQSIVDPYYSIQIKKNQAWTLDVGLKIRESLKNIPEAFFALSPAQYLLSDVKACFSSAAESARNLKKLSKEVSEYISLLEKGVSGIFEQEKLFIRRLKLLNRKIRECAFSWKEYSSAPDVEKELDKEAARSACLKHLKKVQLLDKEYRDFEEGWKQIDLSLERICDSKEGLYKELASLCQRLYAKIVGLPENCEEFLGDIAKICDKIVAVNPSSEAYALKVKLENLRANVDQLKKLKNSPVVFEEVFEHKFGPQKSSVRALDRCKAMADACLKEYKELKIWRSPYGFVQEKMSDADISKDMLVGFVACSNEELDKLIKDAEYDFSNIPHEALNNYLTTMHEMLWQCLTVSQKFEMNDLELLERAHAVLARGYYAASKAFKDNRFVRELKEYQKSLVSISLHRPVDGCLLAARIMENLRESKRALTDKERHALHKYFNSAIDPGKLTSEVDKFYADVARQKLGKLLRKGEDDEVVFESNEEEVDKLYQYTPGEGKSQSIEIMQDTVFLRDNQAYMKKIYAGIGKVISGLELFPHWSNERRAIESAFLCSPVTFLLQNPKIDITLTDKLRKLSSEMTSLLEAWRGQISTRGQDKFIDQLRSVNREVRQCVYRLEKNREEISKPDMKKEALVNQYDELEEQWQKIEVALDHVKKYADTKGNEKEKASYVTLVSLLSELYEKINSLPNNSGEVLTLIDQLNQQLQSRITTHNSFFGISEFSGHLKNLSAELQVLKAKIQLPQDLSASSTTTMSVVESKAVKPPEQEKVQPHKARDGYEPPRVVDIGAGSLNDQAKPKVGWFGRSVPLPAPSKPVVQSQQPKVPNGLPIIPDKAGL